MQGNGFSWQWLVNDRQVAGINGGKPKGMHWKTFQRLKSRHDALMQVSLHDIGRKLGFLHMLLEA